MTVGKNGIRNTVGIPGTGLSYTTYQKFGTPARAPKQNPNRMNNVDVGFFNRLVLSDSEKNFIDGVKAFLAGDHQTAFQFFQKEPAAPDSAFIAGIMLLDVKDCPAAQSCFRFAGQNASRLGELFSKYAIDIDISFPITDVLAVNLPPSILAVRLAEVEVLQLQRDFNAACNILIELLRDNPDSLPVKISLAELVLDSSPHNTEWLNYLVSILDDVENTTPVHSVLLYYRAVVLKNLNLYDAALTVLARIGRKKAGLSAALLRAAGHEKALIYEAQGNDRKARACWEKIYAEDPSDHIAARKLNII